MSRKLALFLTMIAVFLIGSVVIHDEVAEAKPKTYTVSPSTKPINKSYMKYKSYNNNTKHYYMLTSYLESIEKNGGGTLVLKKGTYNVSNVLYIPSNTTVKLYNGAVLKKSMSTGKANFKASQSLIQLVTPKRAKSKSSMSAYRGARNVKFIGYGNATIHMNNAVKSPAISMAHAQNVSISGIQFRNNNQASILHIIGSKNVKVTGNKFLYANSKTTAPAIRLESARNEAGVYPLVWSKNDGTVNSAINISSNTFLSQYNAVRTGIYTKGKYQLGIVISKNKFYKTKYESIFMTSWSKPTISGNLFDDTYSKAAATIVSRSAQYPIIKQNTFIKSKEVVTFKNVYVKNKLQTAAVNRISTTSKKYLAGNTATNLKNYIILLPNDDFVELVDKNAPKVTSYTLSSSSKPLNSAFERFSTYNSKTKHYYVLRSMLERLEMQGGGKITVKKGTYTITNTLYIPSNVTIVLEDGVVLKKGTSTGVSSMGASKSIFQFIAPSKASVAGAVGGYNGTKNVKFYSTGRAKIDLDYMANSFALVLGHNENITIENIDFVNAYGGHFIELDASKNVMINNATFKGNKTTSVNNANEAINLDTPDKLTKGFNAPWTKFDRTANLDITIQNSRFEDLVTAMGTHQYSGEGTINGVKYQSKMHKNVKIMDNTFINLRSDAVHAMNWDAPIIDNNYFSNISNDQTIVRGILSNGSKNPQFKNNLFENVNRAIEFAPRKNATNATKYKMIYDTLDEAGYTALKSNVGTGLDSYSIRIKGEFGTDYVDIIER